MRLKNPNARSSPPPPVPAGAAVRSGRRRLWIALVVLVPLLGAAGWGAWAVWGPDPLREVRAALDRREFAGASELLEKHLKENPGDAEARLLAARAARRGGHFVRASEHLTAYTAQNRPNDAYALEVSLLNVQQGHMGDADRLLNAYTERSGSPDAPLVMEAYLEGALRALSPAPDKRFDVETGDPAVLARLYGAADAWAASRPGRADQIQGLIWQGRAHMYGLDHATSVAQLRRALALDPDHFDARFYLAIALGQEAPGESVAHFEALLKRKPDDRLLRHYLATAHRALGHAVEARRLLEETLGHHPDELAALLELGLLDLDEGKVAAAEPRLRRALELAPNLPETNIAMSRCQQLAGRPDEAAKYRKRFDEIEAERKKPRGPTTPRP